jgi:hypothetical protein
MGGLETIKFIPADYEISSGSSTARACCGSTPQHIRAMREALNRS